MTPDHAAALANLTATQERCNDLLEEARAARRELVALAGLLDLVRELGADERRVLLLLARRLLEGQRAYGRLDLANDPRDFRKEQGEEVQDLLIYSAFIELQRATKAGSGQ
jgi:hypothetical protein